MEAAAPDEQFFAQLAAFDRFIDVSRRELYCSVPHGWQLVITDVRGSTAAIEQGRYKDVNTLGVASIVALTNALPGVALPYVFGGDGATILVPGSRRRACEAALRGLCRMAAEAFSLELRAGVVPVAELALSGHDVRVARYRASRHATFAMFAGTGLQEAERRVKDPSTGSRYAVSAEGDAELDLSGLQCRWRPIRSRHGKMVSLLVLALPGDADGRADVYRRVLEEVERLAPARPVNPETLHLAAPFGDLEREARAISGSARGLRRALSGLKARGVASLGRVLLAAKLKAGGFDGARYRSEVTENTDFRKFDETLRMVLDLDPEQRSALGAFLARERALGTLVFGLHESTEALMTCAVNDYDGDHVHFVDGADGGYAMAAKELKRQLQRLER